MRQNQQNGRRVRGGRSGRKVVNSLNRVYESNGPDIKVRGTASHIAEKYSALARDAHVSGDPVAAENYMQHAEHYSRFITAMHVQQAQRQASSVSSDSEEEEDTKESEEEVWGAEEQNSEGLVGKAAQPIYPSTLPSRTRGVEDSAPKPVSRGRARAVGGRPSSREPDLA